MGGRERANHFAVTQLLCLVGLLLSACGLYPIVTPTPAPTETAVLDDTLPSLPLPILPASVYLISATDGQIWRLEEDGETLERITNEGATITDLDLSPADGGLAYISGNSLIWTDAFGEGRSVLATGPALPTPTDPFLGETVAIEGRVATPRWSPDGLMLAYIHDGVHWTTPAVGAAEVIVTNEPRSDPRVAPPGPRIFDRVVAWSPEGTGGLHEQRLLVAFHHHPLTDTLESWMGLIPADGASPRGGWPTFRCVPCDIAWGPQGDTLYGAGRSLAGTGPGLMRVDAGTGAVSHVVPAESEGVRNLAAYPHVLEDAVLVFIAATTEIPDEPLPFRMHRIPAGEEPVPIREDAYPLAAVLWAENGRGALAAVPEPPTAAPGSGAPANRLIWLPADGRQGVWLPVRNVVMMRWGPSL